MHVSFLFNSRSAALAGLLAVATVLGPGCGPTYDFLLLDGQGDEIRLVQIDRIVNDADLTDEQKRDLLRDLGITDDQVIEQLLNG